jgi:hypothetical protein
MKWLVLAAVLACSSPTKPMQPSHWQVFDGATLVLDVSSQPGPILSVAPLPPDAPPLTSAFMSATSHDAAHEDAFHTALVASHSVDEFLAKLRAQGLVVKP